MLSKKLALVTGAARGIGEATARILAREGAQIVICDLDENDCQKIVKSMENPNKHLALEIDITKRTSVSNAIEKIQKHFDKPVVPDIVVNCAGIIKPKTLLKMSDETFDEVIDVNLRGTYLVNQIMAKSMKEFQIKGCIINISSMAGKIGFAGHSNYSSSKAGVIAFTKSASKELGKYGIRVNCICPGFIETPMADNMMTEVNSEEAQRIKEILKLQIPMGDFGLPEDVAEVAAFLASEKAKYITGAIVDVNGGYY